jgi:hypothetical protein
MSEHRRCCFNCTTTVLSFIRRTIRSVRLFLVSLRNGHNVPPPLSLCRLTPPNLFYVPAIFSRLRDPPRYLSLLRSLCNLSSLSFRPFSSSSCCIHLHPSTALSVVPLDLPAGWVQRESRSTGQTYYFAPATGESQWVRPERAAPEALGPDPQSSTGSGRCVCRSELVVVRRKKLMCGEPVLSARARDVEPYVMKTPARRSPRVGVGLKTSTAE